MEALGNESYRTDKVSLFALASRKLREKISSIQLNNWSSKTAIAFMSQANWIDGQY